MKIVYRTDSELPSDQVVELYQSLNWSAAKKPDKLIAALYGSHTVVTAWLGDRLVGLGNAISDGHLVVYFPHMLVHPNFQHQGIGRGIMDTMAGIYQDFHQQTLIADGAAVGFYEKTGFSKTRSCLAMWIYEGGDHD